ncbi:hypothetical protein KY331_01780 [Candidatus Woesearchaeota archaeon]|nr:hypothetical protein [Candidatus Woesearchaeota archaeon]
MKKISRCENCSRAVYTNEYNFCKRCWQEVNVDFLNKLTVEQKRLEE